MDRRLFLGGLLLAGASPLAAVARQGGWGAVDVATPWYLAGAVKAENRSARRIELLIVPDDPLVLPADLRARALPAQRAQVDGAALLARTRLPRRASAEWTLALAPPYLMQAWRIPRIAPGERVEVVGYPLRSVDAPAMLRVEYLFHAGRVYALRSPPV
jgi:hypothetical protein